MVVAKRPDLEAYSSWLGEVTPGGRLRGGGGRLCGGGGGRLCGGCSTRIAANMIELERFRDEL